MRSKYGSSDIELVSVDENKKVRMDNSTLKRVELHIHTKMSQMDSVIDSKELIETAIKWGHKAIAITDHDGCQAFTNIFDEVKNYNKNLLKPFNDKLNELVKLKESNIDVNEIKVIEEEIEKVKEDMKRVQMFKVLYGSELEMSDDTLDIVVNPTDDYLSSATYVIFAVETTGCNPGLNDSMIKINAVKMKSGKVIDSFNELINPGVVIKNKVIGITNKMLKNSPNEEEVVKKFKEWIGDLPLVAHNVKSNKNMLDRAYHKYGLGSLKNTLVDILLLFKIINKDLKSPNLTGLVNEDGFDFSSEEVIVIGKNFFEMLKQLDKSIKTFNDLLSLPNELEINKCNNVNHINIIAKNKIGLKNMYQLVSYGATEYLEKNYRVPRRLVNKLRDNLLIGSGCYNGEIFNVALSRCESDLEKAMEFYDYIEVQPPSNYSHLVANDEIHTVEEVEQVIEKIVRCAKKIGKIVVATSDAHTLNKEDKLCREILIRSSTNGRWHSSKRHPLARYLNINTERVIPDQYFRTTDEMLEEFAFLGNDIAKEIVITNTNKIADMCFEYDLFDTNCGINLPKIENSDMIVTEMVYKKAFEMYGNPLPFFIEERIAYELYGKDLLVAVRLSYGDSTYDDNVLYKKLHDIIMMGRDRVLEFINEYSKINGLKINGIIGNSYEVIYLIAQKLVDFSHSRNSFNSTRGSCSASLVAMFLGITDINPLPAHYRCKSCKYSVFHDNESNLFSITYLSGFDMQEEVCPKCGEKLLGDGHNIPVEVFLGHEIEKVPDIVLNFSDLIKKEVLEYTKNLFGSDKVYVVGTITKWGEYTANHEVEEFCNYYYRSISEEEKSEMVKKCVGVKMGTAKHIGAVIIVPNDMDITDITPVQYLHNDQTSGCIITHLDYHAIKLNFFKQDILSHRDLTQFDFIKNSVKEFVSDEIIFSDKKLLELFLSPKLLGVTSAQIMNKTGVSGISGFDSIFNRGILNVAKPKNFSELIKVFGLSDRTNAWSLNVQNLVCNNVISFKDVIGCCEDVVLYLVNHGIDGKLAYEIMEFVRLGGASKDTIVWDGYVEIMKKALVESWFIESCSKIKFLFPKGHLINCTMNAIRLLYYKLYHPVIYYAAYFSVINNILYRFNMHLIKKKYSDIKKQLINLELNGHKDFLFDYDVEILKVLLETKSRGIDFGDIDLMKSDIKRFRIDEDGITLIPPFIMIFGLDENVAKTIVEEAKLKPFFSIEDFQKRCHISDDVIEEMKKMLIFKDLPDTGQLSLF